MVEIPLSAKRGWSNAGLYTAIVDSDLARYAWHAKVSRYGQNLLVYAVRSRDRAKMHRVVFERANGPLAAGKEIDHVVHGEFGGLDNRRSNLRQALHAQNALNGRKRSNNTSGFKGVHYLSRTGRFQALIRVNGKRVHLGYYDTAAQAGAAYLHAARQAHGEFACL